MRSLWQKVKIFLLIHLKIMPIPAKTLIRIDPPRFRLPPAQQMHAPPLASCTTPFLEKRLTLIVTLILMHLYKIRLRPSNCHLLQQTRWGKQHGAACNLPAWLFHKNLCLSFHTSFIKLRIIAHDWSFNQIKNWKNFFLFLSVKNIFLRLFSTRPAISVLQSSDGCGQTVAEQLVYPLVQN